MNNKQDITPGTIVYFCRRDLDYFYTRLMFVSRGLVKKRTPKGYKLEGEFSESLYKDEEYFISDDKQEVKDHLLGEIQKGRVVLKKYLDDLDERQHNLSE